VTEQPTTEQPYTEADVRLVIDAVNATALRDWETWPTIAAQDEALARAALDALAAAGRLLPEGASHETQYGIDLSSSPGVASGMSVETFEEPGEASELATFYLANGWSSADVHKRDVFMGPWRPVPINEESTDAPA
jgi:hypothetical protein